MSLRVRLDVEYDGSDYSGWQVQPGELTVQGTLEKALAVLYKKPIRLHGSGRTDSGVHATGQVAHAVLPDLRHSLARLRHSLNALTPPSLVVQAVTEVDPEFDARRGARWRHYRYRLSTRLMACERAYVWCHPEPLSFALLTRCAEALPGSHDFTSFCVARSADKGARCRILEARWRRRGREWHFDIRADRFVHGMVRSLVGTMVRVAEGRMTATDFRSLLARPRRGRCAPPAPACGLTLVKVSYEEEK